jgi:diacylglycerol kinase (ATP)
VRLRDELARRGVHCEVKETEYKGHAVELARTASTEVVVAVGGDGTVNEVANGIIRTDKKLAIMPTGSGNDFVKSVGVPTEFDSALEVLLRGKSKRIDCASVLCSRMTENPIDTRPRRYFVNGAGIGFDAEVAERTTHIQYLSGTLLYVAAVFQTLGKYTSPDFSITLDCHTLKSRNLLIAIGNGICAGGGFYLTPNANVEDGKLDVCMIDEISVPKILSLMPRVMRGKHGRLPSVTMERAEEIAISAPQQFYVHADGEIVGNRVNDVKIRIEKLALEVLVS